MRGRVREAYALLCDANRRAIQIPPDIVDVITQAGRINGATLPDDLEARFWNAYGLLSSSVEPAQRARTFYRNIFYVVLAVLLLGQFFYLCGDAVRGRLADLDKQVIDVRGRAAEPGPAGTPAVSPEAITGRVEAIKDSRNAYLHLTRNLVDLAGIPFRLLGRIFRLDTSYGDSDAADVVARAQLEMLLVFLSGYLLPMMYGLLGACAFVLRKLSDQIDKLTYAHDARVRYSLRLNVGMLAGLAVGWFVKPGPGDATLTSLSPLALAFIAGYGSDLFFVALDRIVQAFVPSGGSATRTVREVTVGGLTTTTVRSAETHVAVAAPPDPAAADAMVAVRPEQKAA